MVLLFTRKTNS